MVNIALRPPPKSLETIFTYLNTNFNRISDGFGNLDAVARGVETVTGFLDVDTKLSVIYSVVAGYSSAPASTNAVMRARILDPSGQPGVIRLTSYTSAFGVSVTTATVNWIVIGR